MTSVTQTYKFSCPTCGQHIEIATEFESRRVNCPGCSTPLIVPSPPKTGGEVPVATLAQPAARPIPTPAETVPKRALTQPPPDSPMDVRATAEAAKPQKTVAVPGAEAAAPHQADDQAGAKPAATVAPISDTRVVVLTPQFKLEIVRDVRSRLADKSHWMPGKKEGGEYNYAARLEAGQFVPVSPIDASATNLSLFGAVLREFHRHNVTGITVGRREFLDEELFTAIYEVLGWKPGEPPISEAEREALTHEQCLKVLEVLAGRYQQEADATLKKEAHRKIEYIRLSDLVGKLEKGVPLRPEEVAGALYYELEEIKQRLEALERRDRSGGGARPR